MIAVLAGGVGAAKFLAGLVRVVPPSEVVAIVNTGDDTELHGLSICPDLDTVTYTVGGANDRERGWGLAGETWATMDALTRFATARPDGSGAGATWFRLGDRDLATHLYRTQRLREGATLSTVSAEIGRAFGLAMALLPMSDDRVRTRVTLATTDGHGAGHEVDFQEYFVGLQHNVPVTAVRFAGIEDATAAPGVLEHLANADVVVIAPSNPIVSIGPILALPGVRAALGARRASVVAVSPIVGGRALKGPADRMLVELGSSASVVSIAERYRAVAGTLVIDGVDAALAGDVRSVGIEALVTDTIMSDVDRAGALARAALAAGSTAR